MRIQEKIKFENNILYIYKFHFIERNKSQINKSYLNVL